jgi:hypothetical protein
VNRGPVCLAALFLAGACSSAPSLPQIRLDTATPRHAIEITGISRAGLSALSKANLTGDEWSALLRVTVKRPPGQPADAPLPVAGRYAVARSIRFEPLFPLDPGREYEVVFDPSRVSRADVPGVPAIGGVVSLPAAAHVRSTVVSAVYPEGAVPENLLRMYVQFSGPMGQEGALGHVRLLDAEGREMPDALLPLDTELWNADRTRFTLLFDPGRVKREILPNRRMGRPLRAGDRVTLVVGSGWRDARGVPLASEFRREYRVGAAVETALDTTAWRVAQPGTGSRDPLTVTFPGPLDHGLLQRALGVARAGAPLPGDPRIEDGGARWLFVPRDPWQAGDHTIVILPFLEDVAGNRIGRGFEEMSPGEAVPDEGKEPIALPFSIGGVAGT